MISKLATGARDYISSGDRISSVDGISLGDRISYSGHVLECSRVQRVGDPCSLPSVYKSSAHILSPVYSLSAHAQKKEGFDSHRSQMIVQGSGITESFRDQLASLQDVRLLGDSFISRHPRRCCASRSRPKQPLRPVRTRGAQALSAPCMWRCWR